MPKKNEGIQCRVKEFRQKAGLSQSQLADLAGVKRQAIYDIESGRYLPNTGVALKLATHLGSRVEDLFVSSQPSPSHPVVMAHGDTAPGTRISVVKVRDQFIGYPAEGLFSLGNELMPASGLLEEEGSRVRLFGQESEIENAIMLMGCDPGFSLLSTHMARVNPRLNMICRFASSHSAMDSLAEGRTHIAGTHLHSKPGKDANISLARLKLAGTGALVMAYSTIEEGFMVARGNPSRIRSAADLAQTGMSFVNREPGAALRVLLDDELKKAGIPVQVVPGYNREVPTHSMGAQMVSMGLADAALGLKVVARAYGLDFVPITQVRCDLVIPGDLAQDPKMAILLDLLQTGALRRELEILPGCSPEQTGDTIIRF